MAAAAAAMHLCGTVASAGCSCSSHTKHSQFIVQAPFRLISGLVADISKMLKIVKLCHP